jgi:hypothetical protein
MGKQGTHRALRSALAGVEACDTQYSAGEARMTRRRTLVLRVRPLSLWIVVGLALAPGIWSSLPQFARLALKWLVLILA